MKRKHVINIALAFFIFFAVLIFIKVIDWSSLTYENQVLHSIIAIISAFIAFTISWLFFQKGKEAQGEKYVVLSMGFLVMGIIRIFISISLPGHGMRLLHYFVNLFGVLFFVMVWSYTVQVYIRNRKWFATLVSTIIIIIGMWTIFVRDKLPQIVRADGFTGFAININYVATVLYIVTMSYFLKEYYRNKKSEDLLIGMVMLLFGLSSIVSNNSLVWSLEWWCWHFLLLVAYIILFYHFLQDYKQTRTSLSMSMSKYQQLFENTPDGIIQIDSNANIVDCNKGECELLGYKKDEIIGKHVTTFFSKESLGLVKKGFPILQKTGHFEAELILIRKDGAVVSVWRTVNAIYNKDGIFTGAIANTHDITQRREVENRILKLNTELEETIKNRTIELEGKIEKLNKTQKAMMFMVEDLNKTSKQLNVEQKNLNDSNKELEAFAYSVSHDLRAPLRAIDGFTRILVEDYASKLDKEGKRIGSVIQDNAKKMGHLIDDLLAFSRLGRASMSFTNIDMKNMVNAIYHEVTSVEERKRIKLTVAAIPDINGDTSMMRQVWINLISNAVKFSSKRKQSIITVSSKKEKDKITYSVKDNGVGFNMKYLDKVFGVFQRLHSEKDFEGTGVGLALVQRIINRHNGTIWAESKDYKGASFYISLPKT